MIQREIQSDTEREERRERDRELEKEEREKKKLWEVLKAPSIEMTHPFRPEKACNYAYDLCQIDWTGDWRPGRLGFSVFSPAG